MWERQRLIIVMRKEHHVVLNWDKANYRTYVDGILGSATSAATSAAAALVSQNAAATSATNSATSETNSANSANASAASATSAANSLDSFTDQYQGAQSSDPATDPDGDAQVAGNLYGNGAKIILHSVPKPHLFGVAQINQKSNHV